MEDFPTGRMVTRPSLSFADHVRNIVEQQDRPPPRKSPSDVLWAWSDGSDGHYTLRYRIRERTFIAQHVVPRRAPYPPGIEHRGYINDEPRQLPEEVVEILRSMLTARDLAECAAASIRAASTN